MIRELPRPGTIRIAGRACRLPMADSVAEFADLLFSGTCAIREIPETRWRKAPFYHPVPGTRGKAYSFAAGVLDRAEAFDAAPFGISPREAEYMDPQQRLMLQVVWEALEDACIVPADLAGQNVGVYVGASMMDHAGNLTTDPGLADSYMMTGSSLAVIANRVSHVFDLHGPSMTIDTACSSSLFALEAAARALASGEIDTAIVGATNVLMTPAFFIGFSEARMLSPTGLCRAFSDKADGYVRGEGAVAFVLRRQNKDAPAPPRDHGRLVHVGVRTTGKSVNIALPSADAQAGLLDKVYDEAGIDPDQLAFVEAHGTGTPVGDPVEAEALGRALGRRRARPLPIGSVKSNIGHLEPAAGCAGLLKALIALERRRLPASLNAGPPNGDIAFDDLNLAVADAALDLEDPACRYAGVSAFGFGGANAHAIVQAPDPVPAFSVADAAPARDRIFFTSTYCRESLKASIAAYRSRLFDGDGRPSGDLLDGLLHFRGVHPYRAAVVANDRETTDSALEAACGDASHPALAVGRSGLVDRPSVFLFSGNGSQYPGMSLAALEADAAFRARHGEIDDCWRAIAGWSLLEKLRDPDLAGQIRAAEIAQPLLFADQVAMVAALAERGVTPAAVLGHSGGEVAAAVTAGALTLSEALGVLFARATAQSQLAGQGGMLAVQAAEADVETVLSRGEFRTLTISAVNSQHSVTVSGPVADLGAFQRHVRRSLRWACVRLRVDYAFHHAMQDKTEEMFRARLAGLTARPGTVPFISSVTGITEPGPRLNGDYWWRNVRRPVRFLDAVSTAAARGLRFFLEIGPDPVLGTYARDTLRDLPAETAVTFAAQKSDRAAPNPVSQAVARILVHGGRVDRARIARRPQRVADGLQSYPWQLRDLRVHERSRTIRERAATGADFHPLLGRPAEGEAGIWSREVDRHTAPELVDHVVAGRSIMPATAFCDMALSAARRTLGTESVELRDVDFTAPLALGDRSISELRTSVFGERAEIRIASRNRFSDDLWQDHARARALVLASAEPRPDGPAPATGALDGDLDGARLYEAGQCIGLEYGARFRWVERCRLIDEATIEVVLRREPTATLRETTALDPVGADAILHGLLALPGAVRFRERALGFVPVRIGRLLLITAGTPVRTGRIAVRGIGDRSIHADIDLFDGAGRPIARMIGVRFRAVRLVPQVDLDRHVFAMDLVPIGTAARADLPGAAEVDRAVSAAFRDETEDEALLLLDALGHRIALDGLSGLGDARDFVGLPLAAGEAPTRYAESLAAMLEACGLVERTPTGLRLPESDDLPAVGALIAGILAERPELGAECALLARLAELMPDLLAGRLDWDLERLFGHSALDAGSAIRARTVDRVAVALEKTVPALLGDRPLNVAELADGAPVMFHRLAGRCGPQVRWYSVGGDQVPAGIPPGVQARSVAAADAAMHGPFDLVLACPAPLGGESLATDLQVLIPHVRDGGLLIVVRPARHDFLDMLLALGNGGVNRVTPVMLSPGSPGAGGQMSVRLEVAGDGDIDGLLVARVVRDDAQPPSPAVAPRAPRGPRGLPALVRHLIAVLRHTLPAVTGPPSVARHAAADLWILAPYRPRGAGGAEDPVFILAGDHPPGPAAERIVKERLLVLARLLGAAPARPKPVWLILPKGAGDDGSPGASPGQAAVWSVMRTAKNEYPALDLRVVDPAGIRPGRAAAMLADLITVGSDETEIVLTPQGPAARRIRMGARSTGADAIPGPAVARLLDDPAGGLDSLSWQRVPVPTPGPGQVLVEVAATGLNYRDVMWAMGLLPEEALEDGLAGASLGIECAGQVVALGDATDGISVGDEVAVIGPSSFSTHVLADRDRVLKLPTGLSPEVGASLPVAYFTAYYGLHHLARLGSGETVLIHGGAGGVGLAAIELAREVGARIVATAGTPVKRALLARIGVDHVLDSRGPGFEAEVRRLTAGEGVDVVLNALSGRSMERTLSLLRPFGRFVELGKQDYYADTPVGLRALKDNAAYFGADLDQLMARKPELARSLFAELAELFAAGRLGLIPIRVFGGGDAVEAFRRMQRSEHIGKIVVQPPDPAAVRRPADPAIFRPDDRGTLAIFGGGSGLGLALAEHQMIKGASSIALVGRSAEPPDAAASVIARARARGAEMTYESCDIADRVSVEQTLSKLRRRRAVTDVVNAAMVLEDMRLADLTGDVVDRTMAAKAGGTRNLDQATRADPVRTFTVFTSMASLIGNHGQAAYVAANAYMEAIVARRRAEGLPGLALGWGAVSDSGYLTRNHDRARLLQRMGGNVDFTVRQLVRAFDMLAGEENQRTGDAVLWVSPMRWQSAAKGLRLLQGPTYQVLAELGRQSGEELRTDDLREQILALSPEAARARLVAYLREEIGRILRVAETAIQTNRPVSDAGVDSLMGVELGMAAQQTLGDDVPLTAISGANSIDEIAEKIVDHIQGGAPDSREGAFVSVPAGQDGGPADESGLTRPHATAAE